MTTEMWLLKDFKIYRLHRKHCGKGEIEQFQLFPQRFKKAFSFNVKMSIYGGKSYIIVYANNVFNLVEP